MEITSIASILSSPVNENSSFLEAAKNKKAFQEMEELFISTLFKEMRKSIPSSGLFEKTHATKMFEEMMDEAFAKQAAASGQFGVAQAMQEQYDAQNIQRNIQEYNEIMNETALERVKELGPIADNH
jgi:Rod binding domain-containing protein